MTHLAPALVRHLWDFSFAIWKHRNDEVHGATDDASQEKQKKIIDAKITEAYQHPDQHSENDRLVLFTTPLPDCVLTSFMHPIYQSTNHLLLHARCTICFALSPHSCAT